MSESIIVALITGGLTFVASIVGVLITSFSGNKKLVNDIKLEITAYHSATDEKIKELTREVREHNNFAKRMPVVENDIKHIEEKITELHKND